MEQLLLINPEQATSEEVATYKKRFAVRAVVTDAEDNVALLQVGKHGYYKLPGGGIEEEEDRFVALERECMEEIGCHIEVYGEVGMIEEHRKMFELRQISYCYLARVVGSKGEPNFTESELANDFSIVWVHKNEVQSLLNTYMPTNKEGHDYIVPRDKCFLAAAVELISSQKIN